MKTLILVGRTARAAFTGMALVAATQAAYAQNAAPAQTTPAPYRNRILGVYGNDTGAPLENVTITDILSGNKVTTTSTGTASLAFLADGGSFIRITKAGYETQTFLAAISPKTPRQSPSSSSTRPLPLLQTIVATDSAPHYISPALNGFEERRKLGFGHFITEAELRKNDAREFSDVLERIPGIRMVTFANHIYIASMRDQKDARVPSFQQFKATANFRPMVIQYSPCRDAGSRSISMAASSTIPVRQTPSPTPPMPTS